MTVAEKQAAGKVEKSVGLGSYIVVGVLALAVGVGAATGIDQLAGSSDLSPQNIAQLRANSFAEHAENAWIAQVNATKSADLVSFHEARYYAGLAKIEAQRAADMATFKRGWEGNTGD